MARMCDENHLRYASEGSRNLGDPWKYEVTSLTHVAIEQLGLDGLWNPDPTVPSHTQAALLLQAAEAYDGDVDTTATVQ